MMLLSWVTSALFILLPASAREDTCNAVDGSCSSGSVASERYSAAANQADDNPRWRHYLEAIKKARAEYQSCNRTDCSCISGRLEKDLWPWRDGIMDRTMIKATVKEDRGVLYQVLSGRLYRSGECRFPARCEGVEYFVRRVLPQLPDLEFVLNDSDYPQSIRIGTNMRPPIFSFSKATEDYVDILYPAWSFWSGGPAVTPLFPQGLGRWDLWRDRLQKTAARDWPWEKKRTIGFFRGSRTSDERDPLVLLSRKRPQLVDAAYTRNQAWRSDADTLGKPAEEEVGLEEHCRYKFLFNMRGVAASFRLRHLFLCRSTVFHVGDAWIEFFYENLQPWVHYVPVPDKRPGDVMQRELESLMEFAHSHDELMRGIADSGADFVWRNLDMRHIECYWRRLLRRYARLLKYKVTLDANMQLIV